MRTLKAALYIRIRSATGKYSFAEPARNKNRILREGYAMVAGKPEPHPEGVYYLRFLRGRKRIWQAVGPNADAALAALQNKQHDLEAVSRDRRVPDLAPNEPSSSAKRVKDAVDAFLSEVRLFRRPKTISEYERMLGVFSKRFGDRPLASITREDLLHHRAALEADGGKGPRTVYNHIMRVSAFLKANGILGLLKRQDKPAYDEPEVEAYDADQLEALFAAADAEERLLFEFFLKTGFRDQEAMYATWKNVDLKGKVIKVRSRDRRQSKFPLGDIQNSRRRQLRPTRFQATGTGRVGHRQASTEAVCVGEHGEEPGDSGVQGWHGRQDRKEVSKAEPAAE